MWAPSSILGSSETRWLVQAPSSKYLTTLKSIQNILGLCLRQSIPSLVRCTWCGYNQGDVLKEIMNRWETTSNGHNHQLQTVSIKMDIESIRVFIWNLSLKTIKFTSSLCLLNISKIRDLRHKKKKKKISPNYDEQ